MALHFNRSQYLNLGHHWVLVDIAQPPKRPDNLFEQQHPFLRMLLICVFASSSKNTGTLSNVVPSGQLSSMFSITSTLLASQSSRKCVQYHFIGLLFSGKNLSSSLSRVSVDLPTFPHYCIPKSFLSFNFR